MTLKEAQLQVDTSEVLINDAYSSFLADVKKIGDETCKVASNTTLKKALIAGSVLIFIGLWCLLDSIAGIIPIILGVVWAFIRYSDYKTQEDKIKVARNNLNNYLNNRKSI